jgi:hypothetical protein
VAGGGACEELSVKCYGVTRVETDDQANCAVTSELEVLTKEVDVGRARGVDVLQTNRCRR